MPEPLTGAPPSIVAALDRLKEELMGSAGANLAGLILYGGLARGRYRPGKSDINVVVLLNEITAPALTAIAPALRTARRGANVVPMILTPAEVAQTAAVFPIKFLDIRDHHIVLHGADPFAGLDVPREQLRVRVVQELRNLTFRTRVRYVAGFGDSTMHEATLANLARPLAVEIAALLRVAGKTPPLEDRSAIVFEAAAAAFGLDADAFARLAAIRQGEPGGDDVAALFTRIFATLNRLIELAESLKETPA